MNHLEDNIYIEQIIAGNPNIFRYLVDKYKDQMYVLAFQLMKNREEAEELAQDGFVKAFQHIGKYNKKAKFSTWLYRIVYNAGIDRIRKRKMNTTDVGQLKQKDLMHLSSANDHNLFQSDKEKYVSEAIGSLKDDEQTMVLLFYGQDKDMREISEIMNISHANIRTKMSRIRKRIKEQLVNLLEDEIDSLI